MMRGIQNYKPEIDEILSNLGIGIQKTRNSTKEEEKRTAKKGERSNKEDDASNWKRKKTRILRKG